MNAKRVGTEYPAIGTTARAEADKAYHKALLFGTFLVLAHLLDIHPSEIEAGGLKFAFRDPAIVYGSLALIFGYFGCYGISMGEIGDALSPLNVTPYRMRAYIRISKRAAKGKKTITQIKSESRGTVRFINVILFPYRITVTFFVAVALIYMFSDIYDLLSFIWKNAKDVAWLRQTIGNAVH